MEHRDFLLQVRAKFIHVNPVLYLTESYVRSPSLLNIEAMFVNAR